MTSIWTFTTKLKRKNKSNKTLKQKWNSIRKNKTSLICLKSERCRLSRCMITRLHTAKCRHQCQQRWNKLTPI
jgi:hypothetical protein